MQTATKIFRRGIYDRVPVRVNGLRQREYIKVGESYLVYDITVDETTLTINNDVYRLEYNPKYAIKILKTKVKTAYNAEHFIKFLTREDYDIGNWIEKIIRDCKPIKSDKQ